MTTYRLPPAFFDDHLSRDLVDPGVIVRETSRYVLVDLTDAQVAELLSDARHYADPTNGYGVEYRGLVASARATVKVLDTPSST